MTSLIVANDLDGGIGYGNKLPWPHDPTDMNRLNKLTTGAVLVMGRKTLESLPKKLPNRVHVVITSDPNYQHEYADEVITPTNGFLPLSLVEHLKDKYGTEVFIFGGKKIYDMFIYVVDTIYLTTFQERYECDTYINRDLYTEIVPHCVLRDEDEQNQVFEVYVKNLEVNIPASVLKLKINT